MQSNSAHQLVPLGRGRAAVGDKMPRKPVASMIAPWGCWRCIPMAMIALTLGVTAAPVQATESTQLLSDRAHFMQARDALKNGKRDRFQALSKKVSTGYPLADYLKFERLSDQFRHQKHPGKADVQALNAFEQSTDDGVLLRRLTRILQRSLADAGEWSLFLGLSKSRVASEMPCTRLRARYEMGGVKSIRDKEALALWIKPVKHPDMCANVLAKLEKRKTLPVKAIWERIFLAMEQDKPEYAEPMLGYLGSRDHKRVNQWLEALESPENYLNAKVLKPDTILNRRVVVDLVLAWSKEDPVAATKHWLKVRDKYQFFDDRYYETHRKLAMRGAYRQLPEAFAWLNSFDARADDLELKEWRVRTALQAQDWPQVLSSIRQLPEEEQKEDHWAYWEARAYEQAGLTAEANDIYTELASLQSYHGFLAADKLGVPYAIENVPIEPDATLLDDLRENTALLRALEFFRTGIAWEGRREWTSELHDATAPVYAASAVLAKEWDLHDRAIFSAAKAEEKQALELRFPMLFTDAVERASAQHKVEPAWVFGVMRRESGYMVDVKSPAGAMGLMQLMPRTAKYVAKLQGKPNWNGDITDVSTNIDFGAFYLRHVRDKFDDRLVLATASYNAGPHRVQKWLPSTTMDADIWIDSIPYTETRRYVRAVLAYMAIYEWHMTGEPTRLNSLLQSIEPAADV